MRSSTSHVRGLLVLTVLAGLSTEGTGQSSGSRPITESDLYRFAWIADPQISPDGSQIVYVRVSVNQKRDGYETSLWLVPASGATPPRRFTSNSGDLAPSWSPDGRRVAFLRVVQKDGKPQPAQIYLMPTYGGEAWRLTDMEHGAGAPVWSPDGKTLAFATPFSGAKLAAQVKRDEPEKVSPEDSLPARSDSSNTTAPRVKPDSGEEKSDVRVITRPFYRLNGVGYLDSTSRNHIWTVPVSDSGQAIPRQLTSGEFEESDPAWSPDGSRIYFLSNRVPEPYYSPDDVDLYSVPGGGGEITRVASIDGVIESFTPSPDGRRIAFVGSPTGKPVRSYDQPDLFVTDLTPGSIARNLTAGYDFDINGGISSDQHAPRGRLGSAPVWTEDASAILIRSAEQGRSRLQQVMVSSGRVTPITRDDHEVVAYTAAADRSRMVVLLSSPTTIGELFVLRPAEGQKLAQVTRVNAGLFSQLTLTAPEEVWYRSFDGTRIQGWIQKPPGFDPNQKYPMILQIHGGPHAAYGYTFYHEIQWMAAKGYVVLYTNPRGSTSYGQKFAGIIQYRYPGDDYRDLMVGVDTLLRRGFIDPKRLGVTGGSGGGLLTNWVITRTDRFAAAVSQRSIADWGNFWFTADFTQFTPFWFRKPPWQDPREFTERSPLTYVEKIRTPLMLVEGEADYRTPPGAGGELMFRALKFLKRPVVMVRFPDETHELSRSGKPRHRVERLRHMLNWFDKYLMDREVDGYAVQ
jgi:dipeptidyl aminopeptidase/acylaminoacyl peptidase